MYCEKCGKELSADAQFCKKCGTPAKKEQTEAVQRIKTGYYVAIAGSIMLVLGLFLPWAQMGLFSASGFQKVSDSFVFLIAAAVTLILSLIGLSGKKGGGLLIVVLNLGALVYIGYIYYILMDSLPKTGMFSPQIGSGIYLSGVGALIAMLGGSMLSEKKVKKRGKARKLIEGIVDHRTDDKEE